MKYCFSASDALVHSTEQEIPPDLAELSLLVDGLRWGPGKVEEGPYARLSSLPLFPSLADGTSPVTCVSLAGGRGLCQPTRYPFGLAHPPSNQGMHLPLTCGREGKVMLHFLCHWVPASPLLSPAVCSLSLPRAVGSSV